MMSQHPTRVATLHRAATTLRLCYYEAGDGVTTLPSKSLESLLSKSKKAPFSFLPLSLLSPSYFSLFVPAPFMVTSLILPYQQTKTIITSTALL
jgi:hypothetical protein